MNIQSKNKLIEYIVFSAIFLRFSYFIKRTIHIAVRGSENLEIKSAFINLVEVHNSGAAFNLFSNYPLIIAGASIIVLLFLLYLAVNKYYKQDLLSVMSISLLFSGILGNTIERLMYGYVTDYIQFAFLKDFPVFNIYDIMIVSGAFVLIILVLSEKKVKND